MFIRCKVRKAGGPVVVAVINTAHIQAMQPKSDGTVEVWLTGNVDITHILHPWDRLSNALVCTGDIYDFCAGEEQDEELRS